HDLDADRRAGGDEDVRGLLLAHQLQELLDEHVVRLLARLVAAEQFVDARFRPGFRVYLLDYDRAIETIPAIRPRQVAGNYDASLRNLPVGHLARGTVIDFRALADVHAHRDHR